MATCKGCGGSYDNDFKFCPYCGREKPESSDIRIKVDINPNAQWVYCEINKFVVEEGDEGFIGIFGGRKSKLKFMAYGMNAQGHYGVDESAVFDGDKYGNIPSRFGKPSSDEQEQIRVANTEYEALVKRLISNGWEAIPVNSNEANFLFWRKYNFRRYTSANSE